MLMHLGKFHSYSPPIPNNGTREWAKPLRDYLVALKFTLIHMGWDGIG